MHHTPLLSHIARYVQLNPEEQEAVSDAFEYRKLKKKEYLLQEGEVCTSNNFVLSGCIRIYAVMQNGNEQIIQFGLPDWWVCDYQSLESKKPSEYFIQAIEATEILSIRKENLDKLFDDVPKLEKYFRLVNQRSYAAMLKRISYIYCQSSEERYTMMSNMFPEFVQSVPQYMLASYLGFTPEFLSMIRAKKQK